MLYEDLVLRIFNKKGLNTAIIMGDFFLIDNIIIEYIKTCLTQQKKLLILNSDPNLKSVIMEYFRDIGNDLVYDLENLSFKERNKVLCEKMAVFYNINKLSRDIFRTDINVDIFSGILINNCEQVYDNHHIQFIVTYYKSRFPNFFISAFSTNISKIFSLAEFFKMLWIKWCCLIPRFEHSVKMSIKEFAIKFVELPLASIANGEKVPLEFTPVVNETFIYIFKEIRDRIDSKSPKGFFEVMSSTFLPQTHKNKPKNEIEEIKLLKDLLLKLLFCQAHHFNDFFTKHHKEDVKLFRDRRFCKLINKYCRDATDSPKLQYLLFLISKYPKEKILILSSQIDGVMTIFDYLKCFQHSPSTDHITNDTNNKVMFNDLIIIETPFIHSDTIKKYKPNLIILYDIHQSLIRFVEFNLSRYSLNCDVYCLIYKDFNERSIYNTGFNSETEYFSTKIESLKHFTPLPYKSVVTNSDKIIIIDDREFKSELPFRLYMKNFHIINLRLSIGDYIISDEICFERKSFSDLISSISDGRISYQFSRINHVFRKPTLLVELPKETSNSLIIEDSDPFILIGFLILHPNIRIFWTKDSTHSANVIDTIQGKVTIPFHKGIDNFITPKTKRSNILLLFPGINQRNIPRIKVRYKNVLELSKAPYEALKEIIGNEYAIRINSIFHKKLVNRE